MKPDPLPARVLINRAVVLEALHEFGKWSFEQTQTHATIITHRGVRHQVMFNEACHSAAEMLEKEMIYTLKFNALVEGLKRCNMEPLYKHIMGQDISEAGIK